MAVKKSRPKPKPRLALAKKQEADLMRVYNAYWSNYIQGNAKAVARLLDEKYTQVGSAESEVFFTKKDAVKFLNDTIDQVAGKADMRNRVIRVEPHKEFILITELTDLFVLIEGAWVYHSKFRASSLMRKTKTGWKFYHQHSSFPDIRAQEGENMSIEKVALENLQLRDAVKRRTIDLEQKTRDLEVEAALERVRSRAMAMRNSSELAAASSVLFHQLKNLHIRVLRTSVGVFDDPNGAIELWITSVSDKREVIETLNYVNLHVHPVFENLIPARKEGKPFALTKLSGKAVLEYYRHLALPDQQNPNETEYFYSFFFSQGTLNVVTVQELTREECEILIRFAATFGLIYTRFLDLQLAEKQTREAQLELSLERVRARTMAMHQSSELVDTSVVLFHELRTLGISAIRTGVAVFDTENETMELWSSQLIEQKQNPVLGIVPVKLHPFFDNLFQAWTQNDQDFTYALSGEEVKEYYRITSAVLSYPPQKKYNDVEVFSPFFFPEGSLTVVSHDPLSDDERSIMRRFANVFGLLYRRFQDLQKAEAQAREAQIEASLERVRASMMAMHSSEGLPETMKVVAEQLIQLGVRMESVSFLPVSTRKDFTIWSANAQRPYPIQLTVPYFDHPVFNIILQGMADGSDFKAFSLSAEENRSWWTHFFSIPEISNVASEERKAYLLNAKSYSTSIVFRKNITLNINNYQAFYFSDEENSILKRFANVFEQAYVRFLDIQKAEAQAREAQIEASLERVRGKAMGMHSSRDLTSTIGTFYKELESLSLTPRRCGVGLLNHQNRVAELSTTSQGTDGKMVETTGRAAMEGHPVLDQVYENWLTQTEFHPILRGNEIKTYNQALRPQIPIPDLPAEAVMYGYFFFFEEGGVYAYTEKELGEDELKVYRRFTSVLSLTYKRFKELKDAEERARIAVRDASLDRVRAEIASMRYADDLQRITPLIWRELRTLGVPFFRCGVLIIREEDQKADYYLSTPEGQPLAALHLTFDTGLQVVQTALDHWRHQTVYVDHWSKEQFMSFARSMMELGQIQTMKSYQGGDQPPESLTLQFIPFRQGMLYVGSDASLSAEQLDLVHALAEAFSTAYARYEDFTRLEAAKQQVENTLQDLRTTQNQLVQSEKMASLGELTAGIAHEIQNPLNFVNNFSEVSKELLDEMKAELASGNWQPATELAENVIQNLEKINFHGKRADSIVKSMLQHSRKSTGQKELTDINALCDEYLRLSYHGLRAKDKSFNAKFETDLDQNVGKVEVMPQEIGRVVLNLINNAFYAVSEKKKSTADAYEPTVTVTTRKSARGVEIRVTDNGAGIPEHIKNKIFQPFFTTKPTGQGTGLGLSLSYDIVTKTHRGELQVQTQEGRGSTFSIILPL